MTKKQVALILRNIKKYYTSWDYESLLSHLRKSIYFKETDFSKYDFKSADHFLSSIQDDYDQDIHWNKYGLADPVKRVLQKSQKVSTYDIEGKNNFITNDLLLREVESLCKKLPKIGGVVGIPRSGLLPASLLSNYMSVPLYSFNENNLVKLFSRSENGGGRMNLYREDKSIPMLVLDDTCFSGYEMNRVRNVLGEEGFVYGAVFTTMRGTNYLDVYSKTLSYPHVLEWNLFDAEPLLNGVLDMDGVLCDEVPIEVCDDGPKYTEYIKNVNPIIKHLPKLFGCKAICTARLEKYRGVTEEWLDKHGVKYGELIMYPGTERERDMNHLVNVAKYKAESYKKLDGAKFFIESCDQQSKYISNLLKADDVPAYVVCPTTKKVY